MTIKEAGEALRGGGVSAVELTKAALARVERLDKALNAFITVTREMALAEAQQADKELAAGRGRGPLHGIPIALKDLFFTRGVRTTGGSKVFWDFVPDHDAAVVEKLRAAGAVLLGKLNMHELAYGTTSANPHFGPVRNPWDTERNPGGSSGGSGAAVASGMVFMAMGSDTGGSIRIPSSFCGTVGLKPTYGRVSRRGTFPLGFTLDHVGPLTRSARDAALAFNAIVERGGTVAIPDEGVGIRGLRVGFPENFYFERLDRDVESAVRGALARAESLGAAIKPVRVPDVPALNAAARVILLAEASAIMERHLGERQKFGADVLALLDQGRVLAATDYVNAQRVRRKLRGEFAKLWSEVDCLFTPTTPIVAPRIGERTVRVGGEDEDVRLASTRMLRAINALGYPAVTIPCGLSGSGLPIGLQIVGAPDDEGLILRAAAALEDAGIVIPPCPVKG